MQISICHLAALIILINPSLNGVAHQPSEQNSFRHHISCVCLLSAITVGLFASLIEGGPGKRVTVPPQLKSQPLLVPPHPEITAAPRSPLGAVLF